MQKYFEQICANEILSMEFLGVGGIGLGRPYHAQLEKSLQFGMADWVLFLFPAPKNSRTYQRVGDRK